MNVNGLGAFDPMGHIPLIDFGPPQLPNTPPPLWPWLQQPAPQPQAPQPGCTLICITPQNPPEAVPPGGPPVPFGGIVIAPPAAPAAPPPPELPPPATLASRHRQPQPRHHRLPRHRPARRRRNRPGRRPHLRRLRPCPAGRCSLR
ncbi:hypothetical protein I545_2012 [Mycobacterium kansasii 662]|nr:hypothetical protein I545_2012 [Mycobacterium kansasii 662]